MAGFAKVLRAELMKVRWLLTLGVLAVAPILSAFMRGRSESAGGFEGYYMGVVVVYGWIFYPIVSGLMAALICRSEHLNGGWQRLLSLPVRRRDVYIAKYAIVAGLLALSQLVVLVEIWALARIDGITDIPWGQASLGMFAGWLAVLPLAALQMWASSRWKAFGAPLALNVVLTFPAIFAVQWDKSAPWYPWGLPVVGMMQSFAEKAGERWLAFDPKTLVFVILGGFVIWFFGGLAHFVRGDAVG